MIDCQVLHLTTDPQGLPAGNRIRVAGEPIAIGRSAACPIHLPDHRVSRRHATLRRADDGTIRIVAEPDAVISINGHRERTAALDPGTSIGIGPYLLRVLPPLDAADITLSVELSAGREDGAGARSTAVTLAALNIDKRRLGLALAAFIILALFLLPLMSRISPAFEKWQAAQPVTWTGLLNPGPVSAAHRSFGMQCSNCHQKAFQAVADAACAKCHARIATHLATADAQTSEFAQVRCADCHAGHEGKSKALAGGLTACRECHGKLSKELAAVRDFGAQHPVFHLAVPQGKDVVRVRDDAKDLPPERSGLRFSHKVHLVKTGVSTPLGNTVLGCRDCHRLEESGLHFAPMDMEKTCQQSRCHKQRFAEPLGGIIPHGSERAVMNLVRNIYLNRLADTPAAAAAECGAPTPGAAPARRLRDCVDTAARAYAGAKLFQESGKALQCLLCHEATATADAETPWRIAAVRPARDWHAKAVFSHARHGTSACVECHDKASSISSADIAMPRIEKCRECHDGSAGAAGKVASFCETCHKFHRVAPEPS